MLNNLTNLGYVAVNKAMVIIHNEVFEIFRGKHLPFPCVDQAGFI